jgi:uncharacterized protein YkwD
MGQHRRSASASDRPQQPGTGHRRGRRSGARTAAVTLTALATAGAGGIAAGVVPAPPGVPDGFVLADGGPFSDRDGSSRSVGLRVTPKPSPLGERAESKSVPARTAAPSRSQRPEPSRSSSRPGRKANAHATTGTSPSPSAKPSTPEPPKETERPDPRPSSSQPSTRPSGKAEQAARAVLDLVNKERAKAGCGALRIDGALTRLALGHSENMDRRDFFDHTDPAGQSPWDRAKAAGVGNLSAENIARGQADAASVMQSWMDSPGHRANILNCDYKTLGVGVRFGAGGPWWTQNFGW